MDPKLAELYGTNQIEAESVAADELAEKLAAADEVNLDGLSDEDAEALAQEILSASTENKEEEENAEETETEESTTETTEKETLPVEEETEKVAEAQADYLGRVMAHAFTQELRTIEKEASVEMEKEAKFDFKALKDGAKKGAGKVGNFLKDKGNSAANAAKTKGGDLAKSVKSKATKGGMLARANPGKAMGGAAAAGAAGGYAFGKKKKEASVETEETATLSAFDTLAQQRAFEILKANGIDPSAVPVVETEDTEKTSAPENEDNKYEALALKVDERAWAMLTEAGYTKAEETEAETEE